MRIERSVDLDVDLELAWELLTRPDDLAVWLGDEVELDVVPGGLGRVVERDGTTRHVRVDEVEVGQRVAWRWWTEGADEDDASQVELTLAPTSDGATRLTVTEHAVPRAAAASRSTATASATIDAWAHRLLLVELLVLLATVLVRR